MLQTILFSYYHTPLVTLACLPYILDNYIISNNNQYLLLTVKSVTH